MLKKIKLLLFCLLLTSLTGSAVAQSANLRRANTHYEFGEYQQAIHLYEKYLKDKEDLMARLRLARSQQLLGDYFQSSRSYALVVTNMKSLPIHKFEYGKVLKSMGKYEEAKVWFDRYAAEAADPILGQRWAKSCEKVIQSKKDSLGFRVIVQPGINTRHSEISPSIYKAGVVFSTNRSRGFLFRFFNGSQKGSFYDLYYAQEGKKGSLKNAKYLRSRINSRYHDGPTTFSPSDHLAYVTRSREIGGRRDAAGYNRVNIYVLENKLDKWRKAKPVSFNSREYNVAHPSVSLDGNTMYFSSDMPGGYGGTDIWVSQLENGEWGRPQNLGQEINTESNEGYPFLVNDSLIYFSSDKAEGFGGKDIFFAHQKQGNWQDVRNAGYPLNTEADDFGYSTIPGEPYGYFVSNRSGGKGDDDIYGFKRYRALEGTLVDSRTGKPLADATVQVMDINAKAHFYSTDDQGNFTHYMQVGNMVQLETALDDYYKHKARIDFSKVGLDESKHVLIPMEEIRRFMLQGQLTEAEGGGPLKDAVVQVIAHRKDEQVTDAAGNYEKELRPEEEYTVVYIKNGYIPKIFDISTEGETEAKKYIVDAELRKGPFILLEGIVLDKEKKLSLPQANIHIIEANSQQELQAFRSKKDGTFMKILDNEGSFSIIASFENYLTSRFDILREDSDSDTLRARLTLIPIELDKVVKVIYYDYDRSNIRILGMRELSEIAYFLKDNPEISVVFNSHTDSRGSSTYNTKLSQRRADAAIEYLIGRGIEKRRIEAVGFGEKQLANDCGDGVDCDEGRHQLNRRTEVKIVQIDRTRQLDKEERNRVEEEGTQEIKQEEYEEGKLRYEEEIRQR